MRRNCETNGCCGARKDLWKKEYINVFKTAVRGEITSRLFKRENQLLSKIVPALYFLWNGYVKVSRFSNYRNI
jgi:hypothetical protein